MIAEGLTFGVISWVLAAVLAIPMSWGLGSAPLQMPLAYSFSISAIVLWLALFIVLSIIASLLPARSAGRLSFREVLAYE